MPLFNARAGRSPSCWVVRAQMEHCALTRTVPAAITKKTSRKDKIYFFTTAD